MQPSTPQSLAVANQAAMHVTQRRFLPLSLENGVEWFRITSRSWPRPFLVMAKIYPILARTRTFTLMICPTALGSVPEALGG